MGDNVSRTPETKTFVSTSEFWMTVVAIGAIAVIYNAASDTSLDLWGACVLGIAAVAAYVLSRGLAKAGTRRHDEMHSRG